MADITTHDLFRTRRADVRARLPVTKWVQNYRSRKALARLTNDELKDIGISRAEARLEAEKPFWR